MHIVLANQWFPPESGWGGVGMYNYAVANAYHKLGHQVTVVASRLSSQIPATRDTDGICVRRLLVGDAYRARRVPLAGRYVRPFQQLAYARRVDRTLRELHRIQPVDIVEFADVNAEGFLYARQPEAPIVVRCHTPTFVLDRYYDHRELSFNTSVISSCERDMIRRAHALTAPSHDMAQVVAADCRIPLKKIQVIPNALPLSVLSFSNPKGPTFCRTPDADTTNELDDASQLPLTVLYVGRLERAKGVTSLVEAVPRVLRECPTVRFVFVGEDRPATQGSSQRAELEAFVNKAGASANVTFTGAVDQPTLLDWYRRADICVVPSVLYESFSYTCAQAMVAGKPVVASHIGGIPETLRDGEDGVLVTPGDPNEIAAAIIRLARDPKARKQMGAAGRERATHEFDPARVAALNLQLYNYAMATWKAPNWSKSF